MGLLLDEQRPFTLKYEPRDEQIKIRDFVIDSVQQGKKNILIDAPVGIGKSFAAMMIIAHFMKTKKYSKFDLSYKMPYEDFCRCLAKQYNITNYEGDM